MNRTTDWDWNTQEKLVADVHEWKRRFPIVHEYAVSDDGEQIAAIVEIDNKKVIPCVNGKPWGGDTFERIWSLKFTPDNRLACAVLRDYEWTVAVDEAPWEEKYDFIWNMTFSPDGRDIAVNIKKENEFGISLNGKSWDNRFAEARDIVMSPDGKRTASKVKIKRLASLDIFGYADGALTVAVDGKAWENKFSRYLGNSL